jgi:hypothetical protein
MHAVAVRRNNAFAGRLFKARHHRSRLPHRKQTNGYLLTVKANQPTVQANVARVVPDSGAPFFSEQHAHGERRSGQEKAGP